MRLSKRGRVKLRKSRGYAGLMRTLVRVSCETKLDRDGIIRELEYDNFREGFDRMLTDMLSADKRRCAAGAA